MSMQRLISSLNASAHISTKALLVILAGLVLTISGTTKAAEVGGISASRSRVPYRPGVDVSLLPEWKATLIELHAVFVATRDERIYYESGSREARRAPWLYAKTGCYARAAHVAKRIEARRYPRPGKIFAFGDWATLRLRTPYDSSGVAWWWFHVAAAYRIGRRAIVLDAAVDSSRPLYLEEWMSKISKTPQRLSVSFCDGYSYLPTSRCLGGPSKQDAYATKHIESLLPLEWQEVRRAGFDPFRVLLDEPPWKR